MSASPDLFLDDVVDELNDIAATCKTEAPLGFVTMTDRIADFAISRWRLNTPTLMR
jgi:hypothetical protein